MQIDTWNREMTNATFLPGPLPRASQIRDGKAGYNPLLECPCSDRLVIEWGMTYSMDPNDWDGDAMDNATECFLAAQQLILSNNVTTEILHNKSQPEGCMASIDKDGILHISWNSFCHGQAVKPVPTTVKQTAMVRDAEKKVVGVSKGVVNVTISMEGTDNIATITLVGPKDKWFGAS